MFGTERVQVLAKATGWNSAGRRAFCVLVASTLLASCTHTSQIAYPRGRAPVIGSLTTTFGLLASLGPPPRQVAVAVYDFPDLTGQRKPTATGIVSDLSTAVSQGASSIVIEALQSAGGGTYFNVVDRTRDADQERERKIISERNAPAAANQTSNGKAAAQNAFAKSLK